MIPIWLASNKKGKIVIRKKDQFDMYLSTMPETVEITVSRQKKQRSHPQNAYYWSVVLGLISEHLGYHPDDLHELMKLQFNSKTINIQGDEIKIGASTANLTTVEFEQYISRIVQWASFDMGIIIPSPSEVQT